jgi:hypothetical protein
MKEIPFTDHQLAEIRPARELTLRERSVLHALVGESSRAQSARCQLDHALVDAECIEGCGTVQLAIAPNECPPLDRASGLVADGEAPTEDKQTQAVLLFAESGLLRYLETYRTDGRPPSGLPDITQLTVLTTLE